VRALKAAFVLFLAVSTSWAEPRRVASLNLTADEILIDILPLDRLVAVTVFADERGTSNIVGRVPPTIVRFPKIDLERIIALKADLVVVSQYTDEDALRLLEKSGLRVYRMEGLDSLAGIRTAILDLGDAVSERGAAERLVARYDAILSELARRLEGIARPRLLYWSNPMTAGGGTTIGALIEGAGGVNVGHELGLEGIVPLDAERVFVADPDVILVSSWDRSRDSLKRHPLLSKLRAVREEHIVEIPTELLVTLSHHAAEACWSLAFALHPDQVKTPRP
jgi:iron complex transport system substrate-binding protein